MLIAAGWQRANMSGNEMPVIHCTTGTLNPVLWDTYREIGNAACRKYPLASPFRTPNLASTMSPLWFSINHTLNHLLPAYCIDIMSRLTGSKPILVRVVNRLEYALQTIRFFITNEWYFASQNLVNLHESMSASDKKTLNIDIRELDWQSYFENYSLGVRKYLLKEDLSKVPQARKNAYRYKLVKNTLSMAFVAFVVRLLVRKTATFGKLWQRLMTIFVQISRLLPHVRRAIVN
jgi:fatty acyl-CoA reductase